jgi:hypothetical protein
LGNTLEEWVIVAYNNIPGILSEECKWHLLQRFNSVPRRLWDIQSTPPHGHPALISAPEPILVVTIAGVTDMIKRVIDHMTHGADFKLVNLLHTENQHLTHQDLNTSIDEPEIRWNIHRVSYDTITSTAKPSSNGQLSYCSLSFGIFDESHRYMLRISVRWPIAINVRFGFKLQLSATPGIHTLYDWCYQTMWLISGAPEDPVDDIVMEKHGAEALNSAVKSWMHAIRTKDEEAHQHVAHKMIYIVKSCTIRQWSETKLANGKPLDRTPKVNAHLIDLRWNEEKQEHLKSLVERYTLWGASGEWKVHRW